MRKLQSLFLVSVAAGMLMGCGPRDAGSDLEMARARIAELEQELQETQVEQARKLMDLTRQFEERKRETDEVVKQLRQQLAMTRRQAEDMEETMTETREYVSLLRTHLEDAGVQVEAAYPDGLK